MAATAQALYMKNVNKHSDSVVALGVLFIVIMLLVPLPSFLIDAFLVFNLALSLIVLLISMYLKDAITFSVLPSFLLLVTLFRLALNIACCRAILLRGDAVGEVIKAFGGFIVGGNYVVGIVIFLILVVIQFLVITNGSQRVAEVAARFTLDAMPGKQMAIDADLNSGLINEDQARARRSQIQKEADFYGAMDGAAKFVRGDSTAAILIILVNIIGGFIIGVAQQKMQLMDALQTYTLLTVGAGIAMQVPALLLSTATGLVVTRSATEANLGQDFVGQILSHPRAITIAAILLFIFLFVPSIPKIPFLLIAGSVGGIAYTLRKTNAKAEEETKKLVEKERITKKKPENVLSMLKMDLLELEVGYGLIPLVNPEQGGSLLDRVTLIRRQIALDMGIVVPPIRIRDNVRLGPNEYIIKIKGIDITRRTVQLNHYLAINPGKVTQAIDGIPTNEPVFNLPALWITDMQKRRAELAGYTVVDVPTIVTTHLSEVVRSHASDILTRQDVQSLVDNIKKENPTVVEELIPNLMSIGDLQKVLQKLLQEHVAIRDLVTILETLADNVRQTKDVDVLVGYARIALARHICRQLQAEDKSITVVTFDPRLEQMIMDSMNTQDQKIASLTMDPELIKRLLERLSAQLQLLLNKSLPLAVLVSPQIRGVIRGLTQRNFPNLHVLAYNEIPAEQEVRAIGRVSV